MKMQNSTALELPRPNLPPATRDQTDTRLRVSELAVMQYPEAEATLTTELDRIMGVSTRDPLDALDQIIGLMQGINVEMLKAYAPVMAENARRKADSFMSSGKIEEDKREGSRTFNQFLRLQEGVVKLGVAQTKVRDELERRNTR
jgi:hypothetical protein